MRRESRLWLAIPAGIALIALFWAAAVLLTASNVHFILLDPRTKIGFEVQLAVFSLFAALILVLFPDEAIRPPLRWVALGLVVLGLGSLGFGYLYPVLVRPLSLREGMYASLLVRTAAAAALATGLAFPNASRLGLRGFGAFLAVVAGLGLVLVAISSRLPGLTTIQTPMEEIGVAAGSFPGLTPEHWAISVLPLGLASAAAIGAIRQYPRTLLGRWLAIAMVLFAGSQLHTMLWPSAYSSAFTTSSLLRAAFTAVVTGGVILELRYIASERAALLTHEREYTRRLEDLAVLRADFTAMVAHELASPLAGIRRSAELFDLPELSSVHRRAVETIRSETDTLAALVDDVQTSAQAEREDFAINPRPVLVTSIIGAAASFACELGTGHQIDVSNTAPGRVLADPARIGQVLRNLLSNAAKYNPPGTPIALNAGTIPDGRVRFEVVDRGPGIHPDDMSRIFEKFGRGHLPGCNEPESVPGVGLGLYLSRRIIRASGSDLQVRSEPGRETCFWFDLEAVE